MLIGRLAALVTAGLLVLGSAGRVLAVGDGIQAGPALLYPSLTITETHNDNIERSSDNEDSDWITSIAPAIRVVLPVRRFYFEGEGGLDFVSYADKDDENATNWFIGAAVGGDFPGGLSFKVADTYTQVYLPESQEYGPGEDSSLNTLSATAGYAIRDSLRLEASWELATYTYDESEDRERDESVLRADLYWKFRPRMSALLEAAFKDYSYDSNTDQDGDAFQLALGLTWDLTAKSTGFAKVGYEWKSFDDEDPSLGTEDDEYYTLAAGVTHHLTSRTSVRAALSHGSYESDFDDNPYYLRTAFDATLSHRFTPKLYGRASLLVGVDDYQNETAYDNPYDPGSGVDSGERSDDLLRGGLALGFDATRWLALELAYDYEDRDSNFDTFDYTVNELSLSARAAF